MVKGRLVFQSVPRHDEKDSGFDSTSESWIVKKFFVIDRPEDGLVEVRARIDGPRGEEADHQFEIRPGESWFGIPYERLAELGTGAHEIPVQSDKPAN